MTEGTLMTINYGQDSQWHGVELDGSEGNEFASYTLEEFDAICAEYQAWRALHPDED